MIRIVPPEDYEELDAACAETAHFDWIVFSSANAVEAFMQRLLGVAARPARALSDEAVRRRTGDHGAPDTLRLESRPRPGGVPRRRHRASALGNPATVRGLSVLMPRADIGREVVGDELRRQGATVKEVVAYRTVVVDPEREGEPDVYRLLLDHKLDVVTFASASSVRSFVRAFGADQAADLLRPVAVAAIGPVTAEAALQDNINTTIMPQQYTVPALVDAIVQHFQKSPS